MRAKLRKCENSLVISGTALIGFAVWNILRFLMFVLLAPDKAVGYYELKEQEATVLAITFFIMIILLGTDMHLRYVIGRGAISNGSGRGKPRKYMVRAWFVLIYSVAVIIWEVFLFAATGELDLLVSTFIDLTSTVVLIEIIISSIRIKSLRGHVCS